jgi:uncharacterized protein
MLIGVMSDSHDDREGFSAAVALFKEHKVAHVFHAGDIVSPDILDLIRDIPCAFDAVFGNCDVRKSEFQKFNGGRFNFHFGFHQFMLEGKKFLLAHRLEDINKRVRHEAFDCVLYGHTHRHSIHLENGILFLNPGETAGFRSGEATAALLEVPGLKARIIRF